MEEDITLSKLEDQLILARRRVGIFKKELPCCTCGEALDFYEQELAELTAIADQARKQISIL
tara:strand:- start:50 stop:235 length:186 start_codon:yes stop_codon:yes gene_type:complete